MTSAALLAPLTFVTFALAEVVCRLAGEDEMTVKSRLLRLC